MTDESSWLVDTNILVHVARGSPLGRHIVEDLALRARSLTPFVSIITVGEVKALMQHFDWGAKKLAYIHEVLAELVVVDIRPAPVLDAYAVVDNWRIDQGIGLGQNDRWIAACALATDATVLTTDHAFMRFEGIALKCRWLDPSVSYSTV